LLLNGPDTALNARLRAEVLANERGLPDGRDAGRISFVSPKAHREIEAELLATLRVPEALGIDAGTRAAWIKNLGWKVASRRAFRATRDRC
jgi:hypothetical protein